jgi:hypothetical protein
MRHREPQNKMSFYTTEASKYGDVVLQIHLFGKTREA